jgi:hypothetical protein
VLRHVHGEVRVRPLVHPTHEDEHRRREADPEEDEAIPAGEVGAAAPPQPDRALCEEERGEGG